MAGNEATIMDLPPEWPSEGPASEEKERFKELQQRLVELNEKRAEARKRLENHKRLKELVDMFGEDAGVQENLVGRNGEVEMELEKMRRLMARVERGVEGLEQVDGQEWGGGEMDWDGEREEENKVLAILG
jgi:hypothetical protein